MQAFTCRTRVNQSNVGSSKDNQEQSSLELAGVGVLKRRNDEHFLLAGQLSHLQHHQVTCPQWSGMEEERSKLKIHSGAQREQLV